MQVPARERELSIRLNRLIGEANCEAALLPNRSAISEWTSDEAHEVMIRCQRAMVATLQCAIELQELAGLDQYSKQWIREAIEQCEEHRQAMAFIQTVYCPGVLEDD